MKQILGYLFGFIILGENNGMLIVTASGTAVKLA